MSSIRSDYDRVIARALETAVGPASVAAGLTACVDAIYEVDDERLAALSRARTAGSPEADLARQILARITQGHGGEIVHLWADGPEWMGRVLGTPARMQAGGNAAQAAWTLSRIGVSAVLSLADRSPEQLSVLDPDILVASSAGVTALSAIIPEGESAKSPHYILEFRKGTLLDGRPLPRSTRIMVRFSSESIERDESFASWVAASDTPPVTLLSGLTTQPRLDTDDALWVAALSDSLSDKGGWVHHELSEFPTHEAMRAALTFLHVPSIGMSLSELRLLAGTSASPWQVATEVARACGFQQVVVHSDRWSMAVCREPCAEVRDALILGNALAGARAIAGQPSDDPRVHDTVVTLDDDFPAEGPLGDGWYCLCVPSLYTPRPRSTVGLGDSFCAGLLLGTHFARSHSH